MRVDYETDPSRYRHWKLKFEGPVATLVAAFGLPDFSAAARGRAGRSGLAGADDEADGSPSARALSGVPKPRPIIWRNVAII